MIFYNGSQGDDVRKIQQKLRDEGYDIAVDGIYGSGTQNAVSQYQQKHGLDVDGIVGDNTYGAMFSSPAAPTAPQGGKPTTPKAPQYTPGKDPGAYQSQYDPLIQDLYNKITQRQPQPFDAGKSGLFAQYRDLYTDLGQQAMKDTMGAAAGLTGGYGSSYAQGVGQQAYDQYAKQLADKSMDIYGLERQAYDQETADLYRQFQMANGMEQKEYDRWQDAYAMYQAELARQARLAAGSGGGPSAEKKEGIPAPWRYNEKGEPYKPMPDRKPGVVNDYLAGMEEEKRTGGLVVDSNSVAALGYSNMTPQLLNDLVARGEVEEYVEDGYLKYRKKRQYPGRPSHGRDTVYRPN